MGKYKEKRGPGRPAGAPNKDKLDFREQVRISVQEFTKAKYQSDVSKGITLKNTQQVIEDYDPVVQLALAAVDRHNPIEIRVRCNAEVAKYLRPQLKSIELKDDPESKALEEKKMQLAMRLADMFDDEDMQIDRTRREKIGLLIEGELASDAKEDEQQTEDLEVKPEPSTKPAAKRKPRKPK